MRRILIPSALLVTTLLLAGCSASSGSSSSYTTSQGGSGGVSAPNAVGAPVADGSKSQVDPAVQADRSIITTGTVSVTVDTPADSARQAASIVESAGGRVDSRTESAPTQGNNGSASLTLRIPAEKLTPTLEKLEALGTVENVQLSSSDVTAAVADTDARVKALQASVDRLTSLLATASDTAVLITIENALTQREADLESMQAQQRTYADQTSMSTINLDLISKADAPVHKPSTFLTGLQAGWDSFTGFIAGLVVVLGVLLPWLIFFGIITVVIIVIVRRSNRKKLPQP